MNRGTIVTIFRDYNNLKGIITASIANWTGAAIKVPREHFGKIKKKKELQRPGVYFLFGRNHYSTKLSVYIGEANNLADRITDQLNNSNVDFSVEVIIFFYSQDNNLTISHTKYLELKMIAMMRKIHSLRLTNIQKGNKVSLPTTAKVAMDTFLDNMKIILHYLRHPETSQ